MMQLFVLVPCRAVNFNAVTRKSKAVTYLLLAQLRYDFPRAVFVLMVLYAAVEARVKRQYKSTHTFTASLGSTKLQKHNGRH